MTLIHVHQVPTVEFSRSRHPERWCFGCRKRLAGELVVHVPSDPYSYYGPHSEYRCDGCGKDRRLFPGWIWEAA